LVLALIFATGAAGLIEQRIDAINSATPYAFQVEQ
jgi:hypothetical protein